MARHHVQAAGLIGVMTALTFLGLLITPDLARAADQVFKMGVIDPQAVLERSAAGKRALNGLKEYAQTKQKVLAGDEEELKNLEKQLKDQESALSEAARKEKQGQFRAKLGDYQKKGQEFQQELATKQKELVDEYMKKIQAATRAVAEKGGYSLVVDKGSDTTLKIVIFNKDTIDLTDQVVKEFDRQNK
jgi:outer membrane protein